MPGSLLAAARCVAFIGVFLGGWAQAQTVHVSSVAELQNAVATANSSGGNRTIALADGTYSISGTLYVNAPGITITGASGSRENVVIQGDAMSASAAVKNLIRVSGADFTLSNLTLRRSGWHLLQIVGELNADRPLVRNVVFRDAYEQMLKVSIDQSNYNNTSDGGIIEDSLFEYTAGIGPQYYIGGIDVHGGKDWIVRRNTFRSIASPSQTVAEFAIHFWNQSANALVERNVIVNCDRGVGFGLDSRGNSGGIIRNNMIYHAANSHPFADVAIYLDMSPGTQVYNNTILTEHSYPRSIEFRFAETAGVLIVNNLANRPVGARDGASGTIGSNVENVTADRFVNPAGGNLRLAQAFPAVVDAGRVVAGLTDDFDGQPRPAGSGIDIGAHEWSSVVRPKPPTDVRVLP